jgi:hypothetical protein
MFHYFAKDQGVIKMLDQKYQELKNDEDITNEEMNTPLMML